MKYIKWIIIFILIISVIGIPVLATDIELDTEPLSEEELAAVLNNPKFEKITSYEPLKVKHFDVRDDHTLVISAKQGLHDIIAVYDNNGNFQYGFKTQCFGTSRVMWIGKTIGYLDVRSDYLYQLNEAGEITGVSRVLSTKNNRNYEQTYLEATKREIDDCTYCLTDDRGVTRARITSDSSFEKITRTDAGGTTVVYDAIGNQQSRVIKQVFLVLLFSSVLIGIHMTILAIKKKRVKTQKQ